jgi:small subunit ribosomal protein S15
LIDRRFSFLSHLRRWDYQKFEWILEKFDIIYKPFPEDQKKVYDVRARRPSIRQLTDVYVDKIKQEKLDEYRKELESKQLDFLKKKVETLEFIRNEQIECKVPVTVTTDEIKIARKQYENLKKQREEEQEVIMKQSVREDYELKL